MPKPPKCGPCTSHADRNHKFRDCLISEQYHLLHGLPSFGLKVGLELE